MSEHLNWRERKTNAMNRLHARSSGLGRAATGFVAPPEPRTIGRVARGRQIVAGNFLFAGHLVEAPELDLWDLPAPDDAFTSELHGFGWLDDLAALGDFAAYERARAWTFDWIDRFGRGTGPGWTPDLTGRRVLRWISNSVALLNGQDDVRRAIFFTALTRQTTFLARRWSSAEPGLPRFEALVGLLCAALTCDGTAHRIAPAARALGRECAARIGAEGGIPSRNPEELLEVFTLLTWASETLRERGHEIAADHRKALARIAPTLRALRHVDGALGRFHGGGRGQAGRLDAALAVAGVRRMPDASLAMGFARMSHGRTSVLIDASPPPVKDNSARAHASTLAFEVTSGRRPVIVNCGSGASFGEKWRRAGRATPSHSTLGIEGFSSARLGVVGRVAGRQNELLVDAPRDVRVQRRSDEDFDTLIAGHDGYVKTHGLTHVRTLKLGFDGRTLKGEDTLAALSDAGEAQFNHVFDHSRMQGVPFSIRFHLHPDVQAELNMGGKAVALTLRSGEVWVFRAEGRAALSLEPSVYLEKGRLAPRGTRQIVLKDRAIDFATRIDWTLAKPQDTPGGIRDLAMDEVVSDA